MKVLRVLIGGLVGGLLATVMCWGGLYLYGVLVLHGEGSLFDTNPDAASLFFMVSGVLLAVSMLIGGHVGYRQSHLP